MRILIIALVFISSVAKGQIQDFQLKGKLPKDTLWIMGTDTASASNKYGLGKWHNADSLISRRAKDYDFFGLGTGEPPLMNEDSIETADTMYVLFHGLEGGIHQKIEMLKEGTIQFDKGDDDASRYLYYIKAKPLQQGEGNPNFNFTIATTDIATDKNNDVAMIGWNVSPGGGREISGESMLALAFENEYYNSGQVYNEFHILHTDTSGTARRPFTLFLDKGNPDIWEGAFHLPKFDFRPPADTDPYFTITLLEDTISQVKLLDPVTNVGFSMRSNAGQNFAQINNDGMTNPTLYFQSWQQAEFASKLKYTTEGTATPNKLVGKDADGFLRTFDWGVVVDSIETNGVGLWTDVGSNMYPTGNEAIHIPSTLGSSTGNLNLIGRFDQAFPTSSLNNIAIGQSAGHGSLAGDDNIYIGRNSGESNTAGSNNINIGYQAGSQFTGSSSVAIGYQAMLTNVSGTGNVAIGDRALMDATGGDNLAVGSEAGTNISSGSGNLAYGTSSLYSITTGGNNVGIGKQAGNNTQSGSRNVLVGALSGYGNGASNNAATDNTIIGYEAGFSLAGDGNIFIGRSSGANETGSNKLYIDNSNTATPLIGGDLDADTVRINGDLSIRDAVSGASTDSVLVWTPSNGRVKMRNASAFGGSGSTDLTIGGAGPTYTIESSTGTDVTVSGTGIVTLSESPANTLVIDATEVDGSATNEAWTIDGDDADTELISNQTYKFEGAGIITTDVDAVNNKLVITGTEVDGSTTNELFEIEENNSSEGTDMLRLDFLNPFDVAVVGAEADISLDLDEVPTDADGGGAPEGDEYVVGSDGAATNEKWAITNFDLSSTNEAWTIDGDAGDTEVISNQTVLFDGTGIVSTTYTASSNTMTIAATEVDGSTTNEAWTVDGDDATTPVVVSNQTLAFRGNRGIDTDLIDGVTDSISLIVDGSEWDAVTIYETDDYMQMYDSGNGKLERISQANYITELESLLTVPADGNGIYDGDGTTPTDTDVSVTDSLEFNGVLKIINDANDRVGVGSQSPEAKLHVRETAATVEAMLETTSEKVELQTKSISDGVQSPFTLSVFNKDANIDLSGDYYQMANITFSKASETTAGGSINFNIGYDSTHVDGVLTLKSRETGATDGLVNVVGGLRYKWTSSASATYTLNTGDFGLTMTTTGAKTATLPDAVTGIIGQYFSIFNNAASGDITIAITGGSGDTIYGDTVLAINESAYVTCVAANKWIINN